MNKPEEKAPIISFNNVVISAQKQSVVSKINNAWKMLNNEGFAPFWHKVERLLRHKQQSFMRKLFHPHSEAELRESAKKYARAKNDLPKLSVVIPVLGQHDMAKLCLSKLVSNQMQNIEIVVIDNGGDFIIENGDLPNKSADIKIIRAAKENVEVFPAFKFWAENTTGDIILFIHSDLIIDEYGFDVLLRYVFQNDQKLGLVGFIGSDEINENGGRGWGTTSNFRGKTYTYKDQSWSGTSYSLHGDLFDGISPAIVVDGCAMALRRSVWNKIEGHENHSIFYYYDKLISCQVLEAGYKVEVLGMACDHISNQTISKERKFHNNVEVWCQKNNVPTITDYTGKINWDMTVHEEAKRRFLREWKDQKHFIPRVIR